MSNKTLVEYPSDRAMLFTHTCDAPRKLIWEVHTDPEHLAKWWGPEGFTNTVLEMNLKPGGLWRYIMHGPDGKDYPSRIQYVEVMKPERLVYHLGSDVDDDPGRFLATVDFIDEGMKTKIVMLMEFTTAEQREAIKKFALEGNESHNRHLESYLAGLQNHSDREILSSRVFDAPRELVWEAWTNPDHIQHWWGPNGFTNTFSEFDLRPGGYWRFVMHGPNGANFPNESVFVEIVKPECLVFDHTVFPKFRATIVFEDLGGKTRVIWRMLFETVSVFDQVKAYAIPGNQENLDKLEVYLKSM